MYLNVCTVVAMKDILAQLVCQCQTLVKLEKISVNIPLILHCGVMLAKTMIIDFLAVEV